MSESPNVAPKRRQQVYLMSRNKFLTSSELSHLTTVLERALKSPTHARDALLLMICLHTGGRATEILNLRKSDFDEVRHSIFITGIKGSRDRELPIPKWLSYEIRQYLKLKMSSEKIFPITYNRFRQIWLHYRPVQKKLHSLRHTFAINVYMREKDVRLLQLALGHKSILNTMVYVDFCYSLTELRRLVPGN